MGSEFEEVLGCMDWGEDIEEIEVDFDWQDVVEIFFCWFKSGQKVFVKVYLGLYYVD